MLAQRSARPRTRPADGVTQAHAAQRSSRGSRFHALVVGLMIFVLDPVRRFDPVRRAGIRFQTVRTRQPGRRRRPDLGIDVGKVAERFTNRARRRSRTRDIQRKLQRRSQPTRTRQCRNEDPAGRGVRGSQPAPPRLEVGPMGHAAETQVEPDPASTRARNTDARTQHDLEHPAHAAPPRGPPPARSEPHAAPAKPPDDWSARTGGGLLDSERGTVRSGRIPGRAAFSRPPGSQTCVA